MLEILNLFRMNWELFLSQQMKDKKFNYVRIISSPPHVENLLQASLSVALRSLRTLWQWTIIISCNRASLLPNVIHFSFSLQQCETRPVSQPYESQSIVADGWKLMLVCFVLVHAWEFIISGSQLKIEKFDILQWGPIKPDTGSSPTNLSLILQESYLSFIWTWGRRHCTGQIERNLSNYCLHKLESVDNTITIRTLLQIRIQLCSLVCLSKLKLETFSFLSLVNNWCYVTPTKPPDDPLKSNINI